MPTQRLLWTALPNGLTDDRSHLRVSVLLSPRLDPEGAPNRVDTFAHFARWPDVIREARFTITLGSREIVLRGDEADDALDVAYPDSWAALFTPATRVRPFVFRDRSAHRVVSFDAVAAHDLVRQFHTAMITTSGESLPTVRALLEPGPVRELVNRVAESDRKLMGKGAQGDEGRSTPPMRDIERQLGAYLEGAYASSKDPANVLASFQLFHTPMGKSQVHGYSEEELARNRDASEVPDPTDPRRQARWREFVPTPMPSPAQLAESLDFHQIVAAMNQYPRLLRRLGLVVDFLVPRHRLVSSEPAAAAFLNQTLRVQVTLPDGAGDGVVVQHSSPRTAVRLGAEVFEARSRTSGAPYRVQDGLLRLERDFALLQADVDGAASKMMNFARTLHAQLDPTRHEDPVTRFWQRAGAPAIRSAGLMLVHRQRAAALEGAFARNTSLNTLVTSEMATGSPAAPTAATLLYREDLVRGFRFDVWSNKTERWHSLCERIARYTLGGGAVRLGRVHEEGTVRLAATTAADDSRPELLWLHEAVMSWSGWSLAARPPIRSVLPDDATEEGGPAPVSDGVAEVPPGLRLETEFEAAPGTLPRLRYGRAYALRARVVDLAGNSLPPSDRDYHDEKPWEHATPFFRFDPIASPALALVRAAGVLEKPAEGESMERLAIRTFNEVFNDPAASLQQSRRYAVPPRTSVREAELHGMLDAGGVVDPSTFTLLANTDADLTAETFDQVGPLGGNAAPVTYALLDEGAPLPYLPDPLCLQLHARFEGHPHLAAHELIPIKLYPGTSWPHALPFQILAFEGASGEQPRFDEATHTLRVPLPKGYRVTLRISAVPTADMLDYLGVWQWLDPELRQKYLAFALAGQLWALTPWRDIELVHATQRPLLRPGIEKMAFGPRALGDTHVTPSIRASVSLRSTARVDLQASWHEPKPSDKDTAGEDIPRTDHAFSVKITDPSRYRTVEQDSSSTGRAEHTIDGVDRIGIGSNPDVAITRQHQFGDTRYRRVEYWLEGTTRFREFLPTDLLTVPGAGGPVPTEERINVVGDPVRTWVKSSAPPPAPSVLYVMPTFGWTRAGTPEAQQTSWRRGGGLRVYLDGPWNVTGYGEMLAVTLLPPGFSGDANDAAYRGTVTQWANDPAWKSPFVKGMCPVLADFPRARTAPDASGAWLPAFAPATEADQPPGPFATSQLWHPGLAANATTGRVNVAPHDVHWDEERHLWYCDIELRAGTSYFPFVRLALARYQPVSEQGAHLSTIVMADFMALTPDRWLTVARTSRTLERAVRVYGRGPDESAGYRESMKFTVNVPIRDTTRTVRRPISQISKGNIIEVTLERRDTEQGFGPDFGWHRVTNATITEGIPPEPSRQTPAPRIPRPTVPRRGAPTGTSAPIPLLTEAQRLTRATELLKAADHVAIVQEGLLDKVVPFAAQWEGLVQLPEAPSDTRHYRLVIAEYEEYLVDDVARGGAPDDELPEPYATPPVSKNRRLVFVEHVHLQ